MNVSQWPEKKYIGEDFFFTAADLHFSSIISYLTCKDKLKSTAKI